MGQLLPGRAQPAEVLEYFLIESRTVLNESGDLRVAGEYLASVVVDKYALPSFFSFLVRSTQPNRSSQPRFDTIYL